jgi:hypothetical protein
LEGQILTISIILFALSIVLLKEYVVLNALDNGVEDDINEIDAGFEYIPNLDVVPGQPVNLILQNDFVVENPVPDFPNEPLDLQPTDQMSQTIPPQLNQEFDSDDQQNPTSSSDLKNSNLLPTTSYNVSDAESWNLQAEPGPSRGNQSSLNSLPTHRYSLRSSTVGPNDDNLRNPNNNNEFNARDSLEEIRLGNVGEEARPAVVADSDTDEEVLIPPAPILPPGIPEPEQEDLNININVAIENGVFEAQINAEGDLNVIIELFGMIGPILKLFRNVLLAHLTISIFLLFTIYIPNLIGHVVFGFISEYYFPWINYIWQYSKDVFAKVSIPVVRQLLDGAFLVGRTLVQNIELSLNMTSLLKDASFFDSISDSKNILTPEIAVKAVNSGRTINAFLSSVFEQLLWAAVGWITIALFILVWVVQTDLIEHLYFRTFVRLFKSVVKHSFMTIKVFSFYHSVYVLCDCGTWILSFRLRSGY